MDRRDRPEHEDLAARASVLVPLFFRRAAAASADGGGATLHALLTKRPDHLRRHAGEVCFPGGKQDPGDGGCDLTTALREAEEEVGLAREHVEPVCRLETLESSTGLCVTPIVGLVEPAERAEPSSLKLADGEVEAAFAVPLSWLSDDNNLIEKREIEWRGGTFTMRTYHYQAECGRTFKIWGLTAHIAHHVAMLVTEGSDDNNIMPPAAERHRN
jgi:coenzyme A diphosphatase NUDT7